MTDLRLLSKSQYTKGRKCLRRLWLFRNRPEWAKSPSLVQKGIFEQGHEVGRLAQALFPNGVLISENHRNSDQALASTKAALESGATALFEAAFVYDGILIRADIVAKNQDGSWSLYEVKSTTAAKKVHLPDVAVQTYVIRNSNTKIILRNSYLIHLNSQYVRDGAIDVKKLFVVKLLDGEITEALAEIPTYLNAIRAALASKAEPAQLIGSICKNPYVCEFRDHCWSDVCEDSIHYLYRISDQRRAELIQRAIERVREIPDDIALTELQFVQLKSERDDAPVVDRGEIHRHLAKLKYPLWFLDFETVGFGIPEFDGTRPYQALPFQFSLHVQRRPEQRTLGQQELEQRVLGGDLKHGDQREQGEDLEHVEFLFGQNQSPCRELAEALCAAIGDEGSVVAYHASFEVSRIRELADAYPDLSAKLESMIKRIWDLEAPFAKKHFYHPRFRGSSSIKKVLPVLVPDLDYDHLEIGKGDLAQLKYREMIALPDDSTEKEEIRRALLGYCKLDTLAMVRVLAAVQGCL